ncbi:hypothetical protein EKH77_30740 [Streptomyces luteoverticillatus]|uniref:Uncharacterized protein n=1 Tax=Streptomyces luteoverticillatus TaxID=66425 RepID=A0A3Q9G0J1_STRLT|nr:hypothetical protein EKH77_30740 [Streptomyces luteoverticillatus]
MTQSMGTPHSRQSRSDAPVVGIESDRSIGVRLGRPMEDAARIAVETVRETETSVEEVRFVFAGCCPTSPPGTRRGTATTAATPTSRYSATPPASPRASTTGTDSWSHSRPQNLPDRRGK